MSIGKQVVSATVTGSGNYAKPGVFRDCKITGVSVFNGQVDNIPNYVVEFQVGSYTPGVRADGTRLSPDTHPPGSTVTFHSKLRPDILRSVLGNLKAFALAAVKQKAADNGIDPAEVTEASLDPAFIDNDLLCNNSKVVGLVMNFEVIEKPNVKDKTKATSRFNWQVKRPDGIIISA